VPNALLLQIDCAFNCFTSIVDPAEWTLLRIVSRRSG